MPNNELERRFGQPQTGKTFRKPIGVKGVAGLEPTLDGTTQRARELYRGICDIWGGGFDPVTDNILELAQERDIAQTEKHVATLLGQLTSAGVIGAMQPGQDPANPVVYYPFEVEEV